MKKILFALAIAVGSMANAQLQDSTHQNQLYVKANALFLPVGVLNAGLEYQVSNKMTVQADVFISPWKSFMGKYAQMYMLGFDGRYYFNEAFKHFYVGANISAARYKMQKYNYWNNDLSLYPKDAPSYINSDLYQDGFSYFLGATAGYQWQLSPKWNLDLYMSAGTVQSFYRGYHKTLGIHYDADPARKYNRSGEFLPYRGGLMISYKLK